MTSTETPPLRRWFSGLLLLAALPVVLVLTGCMEARTAATESWSGVAVGDDRLFVGTQDGRLVQLDAASGTRSASPFAAIQDDEGGFPAFYGTPVIANGRVYLGGYHGFAYSLRAEDLSDVRSMEIEGESLVKGIAGALAPTDDAVVVAAAEGANAGRIYVLDGETLGERCRYPASGEEPAGQLWSTPVLLDGIIYVGGLDHRLHAVAVEDCSPVWPEPADLHGAVTAEPLAVNGNLYVGTFDRRFYEVDQQTGETRELFRADNWFWGRAATDGQRLYVPNMDGRLYAYDLEQDEVVWRYPAGEDDRSAILSTPVVFGDSVVFGSDSGLLTVVRGADGGFEWDQQLGGGEIRAPLTVEDGIVYVHTVDGEIHAINLETRGRLWEPVLLDEVQ
ncbi:MAG: PQQ-binding-like beta-propeller repeat protein [Dehalococcoidia bacterium]